MSDQAPPPPPPPSEGRKAGKAQAKAEKAHAKAMRPWYKKKRWIGSIVILVIIALIATTGGGDDVEDAADDAADEVSDVVDDDTDEEEEPKPAEDTEDADLYPDRPDEQSEDKEAAVGDSVQLSGYTATLHGAEMRTSPLDEELVVIQVSIENRDDEAQPYNLFDWRIQTENGQVLDPTFSGGDNDLESGDLVSGGTVEGEVPFDVGPGTYFVIYKPDAFDAARGIWQITVG